MTKTKKNHPTDIYYARNYELIRPKQQKLLPINEKHEQKFVPIKVPNEWITGSGSRIVALFHKTGNEIVCPHFWELKAWIGCPFQCSYCYLQGTFRGANRKKPRMKNIEDISYYLEKFLRWADSVGLRVLLNAGELADSLAIPEYVSIFLKIALPILKRHPSHKILFLTKGGTKHINVLEEIPKNMRNRFIVSFSINPDVVVQKYEKGTASSADRIKAAKKVIELGYELRIRIDPMIPIEGWILRYIDLIHKISDEIKISKISRITIGSLRALKKTIKFSQDKSWLIYVNEPSAWGLRIEHNLRVKMYELVIETLEDIGYRGFIALCKEPPDIWIELQEKGLLDNPGYPGVWENVMCNCKL